VERNKYHKLFSVIGLAIIVTVIILCFGSYRLFKTWMDYHECSAAKLTTTLEKYYVLKFPDKVLSIKGAKTRASWDGGVGFIVLFVATPDVVTQFLNGIMISADLPYTEDLDPRLVKSVRIPTWYTEPVPHGRIVNGAVTSRLEANVIQSITIVIDDSRQENIVYLSGGYDTDVKP
jgi:hypothetical protein